MVEEKEYTAEITSQHSAEEIFEESVKTLELLSNYNPLFAMCEDQMINVVKEILHWAFAKQGTHEKPSAMVIEALKEAGETEGKDFMEGKATDD